MDYLSVFNKYLILNYFAFIFLSGWVLFNWMSDIGFDMNDKIKNSSNYTQIKLSIRLFMLVFMLFYFIVVMIPVIKDTSYVKNKQYLIDTGNVYEGVSDHGAFGLFRHIIVTVNGQEYKYQVLFADENILEGDEVQINYLPNTTWAVVKKIE